MMGCDVLRSTSGWMMVDDRNDDEEEGASATQQASKTLQVQ